ncbi:acetyltransferase [Moorena sp. SIO4A5]|uniref:acetyltransferase n=1 Tax=Moorena sp. SIO4A5 TaxID=2607838 RepID=UPI0013CDBA61|nr:acetyltransferase [Moorena sp. SIO4A5]NEO21423.1 acetyltransferase [Moorena sp. SIO4A5]
MQKIIVWGASGHALVVIDALAQQTNYSIVGLIDDINPQLHGSYFHGLPILGGREQVTILKEQGINCAFVAIGNNQARIRESNYLRSLSFDLLTAIHPRAIIAPDVNIGSGTVICAGAVVTPAAQIGQDVIINTSASVDHECIVEDGVHIGPGVHIGGRATIKHGAWIGIGAVVSDRITIGMNTIVGAGSVVVRDIPPGVVAYGVPAKIMRKIDQSA